MLLLKERKKPFYFEKKYFDVKRYIIFSRKTANQLKLPLSPHKWAIAILNTRNRKMLKYSNRKGKINSVLSKIVKIIYFTCQHYLFDSHKYDNEMAHVLWQTWWRGYLKMIRFAVKVLNEPNNCANCDEVFRFIESISTEIPCPICVWWANFGKVSNGILFSQIMSVCYLNIHWNVPEHFSRLFASLLPQCDINYVINW